MSTVSGTLRTSFRPFIDLQWSVSLEVQLSRLRPDSGSDDRRPQNEFPVHLQPRVRLTFIGHRKTSEAPQSLVLDARVINQSINHGFQFQYATYDWCTVFDYVELNTT